MNTNISKEIRRLNHIISETDAVYHEIALKIGLTDSAMGILYTIYMHGESCPLQEICRFSCISKQTINSAMRKLESNNIVYLEQKNKKNKIVYLTEKGKQLAENTVSKIIKAENEIFASWAKEDIEKYLSLSEMYLNMLKEKSNHI